MPLLTKLRTCNYDIVLALEATILVKIIPNKAAPKPKYEATADNFIFTYIESFFLGGGGDSKHLPFEICKLEEKESCRQRKNVQVKIPACIIIYKQLLQCKCLEF